MGMLDGAHRAVHHPRPFLGAGLGLFGHLGGAPGVAGHLEHGRVHLFHGGGRLGRALALDVRPARGLLYLRRKLFRGGGQLRGHVVGLCRGPRDAFVLLGDDGGLALHLGGVDVQAEPADDLAVQVLQVGDVGQHVHLAALVAGDDHLEVGDAGLLVHGPAHGGLAAGVVIEHLGQGAAVLRLGIGVDFQHVHAGLVGEHRAFLAVHDQHGHHHGLQHALREAQLFLQVRHHGLDGAGQVVQFVAVRAFHDGAQVAPGHAPREVADAVHGAKDDAPGQQHDGSGKGDDGHKPHHRQQHALLARHPGQVVLVGGGADLPPRERHGAADEDLGLAVPGVFDLGRLLGHDVADEIVLRRVGEQQIPVGVRDEPALGVEHEGVALLAELHAFHEAGAEACPVEGDGDAAARLSHDVEHGSRDGEQHVALGALEGRCANEFLARARAGERFGHFQRLAGYLLAVRRVARKHLARGVVSVNGGIVRVTLQGLLQLVLHDQAGAAVKYAAGQRFLLRKPAHGGEVAGHEVFRHLLYLLPHLGHVGRLGAQHAVVGGLGRDEHERAHEEDDQAAGKDGDLRGDALEAHAVLPEAVRLVRGLSARSGHCLGRPEAPGQSAHVLSA